MYQNVRGVKSKMVSLERIGEEIEPSIICLTETHLEEDDEIKIPGYKVKRKDRNKYGGGVLIAYKKSMKTLITILPDGEIEAKWVKVQNSVGGVKIGVVYCPQETETKKEIERVYEELEREIGEEKDNETTIHNMW